MKKVTIYTSQSCPYCIKAKKLLKMLNLEFEEINSDDNFNEMCEKLSKKYNRPGIATVPQIIINDHYIGGYDDLEHLYKTKKLDEILNK